MASIETCEIVGVLTARLKVHADERGRFIETFRQEWFPGMPPMVQGNRSDSVARTLRGLHYHLRQADYWYVPSGRLLAALHDLRRSSPTHGRSLGIEMADDGDFGLYIPPGVAHGFQAITDVTLTYLVDSYYDPDDELGLAWDDPAVQIEWPHPDPLLSERDQANPKLADIPAGALPS